VQLDDGTAFPSGLRDADGAGPGGLMLETLDAGLAFGGGGFLVAMAVITAARTAANPVIIAAITCTLLSL
jgi:hypothetical protein